MSAVHVTRQIDSERLDLPELKPFIGKLVEITIQEKAHDNGQGGRQMQPSAIAQYWVETRNGLPVMVVAPGTPAIDPDNIRRELQEDGF